MAAFFIFMEMIIDFMKTPIEVWNHTISMWGVFMFVILGSIVFGFLGSLFNS